MKLTQRAIDALTLPPGKKDAIHFDDTLPGFGIRIRAAGSKTYVAQYKIGTRQRRIVLGSTALLKLDQARARAQETLARVKLGGDPAGDKAVARLQAGETFAAIVRIYLVRQKARLRPRSYANEARYLNVHFESLHELHLARIDRREVAAILSAIATDRGPAAADRARASLSGFLAWAMKEGLLESNPVLATNTHRVVTSRDRVLGNDEIAAVWRAAQGTTYGDVVRMLILTAQRREEIGGLRWSEVDFAARCIHLPAERSKNGRPHDIPLSDPALQLLQARLRTGAYVFGIASVGFCAWDAGKKALGAPLGTPWVLHDLRRTVATHMAEDLGIQPHIIELVLNHAGHRTGVAGVYNRSSYETDKRRALDLWAAHVVALAAGGALNVVPLRA